ncbi:MAG: nucleotide-binding protein [Desulfobacca sp.]|uniref:nucleotide-binding protein n=1 Tax=Desulfobacca sp. TaxID=2067990 RepID=UPI0040493679
MIMAVASGKGGTGKTTVSASLAAVWDKPVLALDLDVEEPNLHLFLKPEITGSRTAFLPVPRVQADRCTYCGACADLCQFQAISVFGEVILTFPDMCHGCGGCLAICPTEAVQPEPRELGLIQWGQAGAIDFLHGTLRVGEAMSPPLMRQVKVRLREMLAAAPMDVIIDAPPGVSCPAVTAVLDSDIIVLVTEPTPFGVYDFQLAWEAFTPLGKPMGAVINRAGVGTDAIYRFCAEKGLPILAEIPYDRAIAAAYAQGHVLAEVSAPLRDLFLSLAHRLQSWPRLRQEQEAACA